MKKNKKTKNIILIRLMITTNYGKLCIGNRFYSGGGTL